jgi:hypothetical protein
VASPALSFAVRVGIPGCLTIEIQAVPQLKPVSPINLVPQLNQPVLATPSLGDPTQLISRAWGAGWATPLTQKLVALGGNTAYQLLIFECPSLDATDMAWGATGTIDATTDPVTLVAPSFGTSLYQRAFAVGDYILWNDTAIVNGRYSYEIDQITALSGNNFTLARRGPDSAAGAQFGSPKTAHTNVQFFRLIDKTFPVLWQGEWQVFKFLWDNMIIAAVSATAVGV